MPVVEISPRLLSKAQAAAYCGLSCCAFDKWRKEGRMPGPLPGTSRWDRTAIDRSIDDLSKLGSLRAEPITPQVEDTPKTLADWREKRDARRNRVRKAS